MLGETDPTDKKLETAEIKRRSIAETEPDLPTESLGKIIELIPLSKTLSHFYQLIYVRDGCHHH